MSIIIGGDLVPTESNKTFFMEGNTSELLGNELIDVLKKVDYRIFNLETPLTDNYSPIVKAGPALMAMTGTVKGIKAIGADLLTLANNHIMDQNAGGLNSTIRVLKESGISYVGAGQNAQEACRPYFFKQEEKCFGVLAFAEHEFSISGENSPGACGFDPVDSFDLILDTKRKCDFLIILYHGGKEYYRYPSPYLRRICKKMIDKGANLIVCQHSHCVGCKEEYKSGTIVYGQGNFLFNLQHDEYWANGLLIKINNSDDIEYIPIIQTENGVKLADQSTAKAILDSFVERSNGLNDPWNVENEYDKFAQKYLGKYLFSCSGLNRTFIFRVINKLSGYRYEKWLLKRKYSNQHLAVLENFIECEAHRELFLRGIRNRLQIEAGSKE